MPRVDRSAEIKERIRLEASRLFAEQGFTPTGVRDIAAAAHVDPTIVLRHFGSKENLFVETITLPDRWHDIMSGPLEDLAARLLTLMFERGTTPAPGVGAYSAMVRATDRDEVRRKLRQALDSVLSEPLESRLTGPFAQARAHLFASAVIGLLTSVWVIEDETLRRLDVETLVIIYAPPLQDILTGAPGGTGYTLAETRSVTASGPASA